MSHFSEKLNLLEKQVIQLVESKKALGLELDRLKEKEQKLIEKLEFHKNNELELTEKNKILRIAGGSGTEGGREIKLKINEIVREVDKCIAQLNQ